MNHLKMLGRIGVIKNWRLDTTLAKFNFSPSVLCNPYSSTNGNEPILEDIVKEKLQKALQPEYLDVVNESAMHNVPRGSASHIRVTVVSPLFNEKNLVQRHRMINAVLAEEIKGPIHALAIEAIASKEAGKKITKKKSPPCKGGMGL